MATQGQLLGSWYPHVSAHS